MAAVLATFRVNQGVNQSGQSESGESVQGAKAPRVCIRILPDSPIHLIHLIHFGLKMRMAAVLATFRVNQGVNQNG